MSKVNIILLGEQGVGKTTLLHRFQTGQFKDPNSLRPTINPDLHIKNLVVEGKQIGLFIWDTAGQERYRSVVRSYYRQGEGVLLVYDVTNPETFYELSKWLCDIKENNEKAQILIAGNKNEDSSKKVVAVNMVKNFAKEEKLEYMEMSAKSGKNVEEAFLHLTRKVLISKGILTETPTNKTERDSSSNSGKNENNDIIQLEDTPKTTSKKKKTSWC